MCNDAIITNVSVLHDWVKRAMRQTLVSNEYKLRASETGGNQYSMVGLIIALSILINLWPLPIK